MMRQVGVVAGRIEAYSELMQPRRPLSLTELPPRPKAVSPERLREIFGGQCSPHMGKCDCDADCCDQACIYRVCCIPYDSGGYQQYDCGSLFSY